MITTSDSPVDAPLNYILRKIPLEVYQNIFRENYITHKNSIFAIRQTCRLLKYVIDRLYKRTITFDAPLIRWILDYKSRFDCKSLLFKYFPEEELITLRHGLSVNIDFLQNSAIKDFPKDIPLERQLGFENIASRFESKDIANKSKLEFSWFLTNMSKTLIDISCNGYPLYSCREEQRFFWRHFDEDVFRNVAYQQNTNSKSTIDIDPSYYTKFRNIFEGFENSRLEIYEVYNHEVIGGVMIFKKHKSINKDEDDENVFKGNITYGEKYMMYLSSGEVKDDIRSFSIIRQLVLDDSDTPTVNFFEQISETPFISIKIHQPSLFEYYEKCDSIKMNIEEKNIKFIWEYTNPIRFRVTQNVNSCRLRKYK